MAEAYYPPTPATDGATMNPVPSASFQVFETTDTTFSTPLSLRVGSGNPTTTVTASETLATLPGVYVTSPNFEHIWKSGSFEWRRDSIDGAKAAVEAAKVSASDAVSEAAASAVSARDAANLVDAPADTAVTTLINDPATQTSAALNATIAGAFGSLFARDYLTAGATAAQNTTALNQAISTAATQGLDVCFDGVICSIDAELSITTAGLRLWSSTPAACHITQTVMGQGVFFINAGNVTLDGFTLTGTLTDQGATLSMSGHTGDVHHPTAIKVQNGVDGLTVRNIESDLWFCGLAGFPYPFGAPTTPVAEWKFITNLDVDHFNVKNVWAAVRMSGLTNASYSKVTGSYKPATGHTDADSAPPHLFYITNKTESDTVPLAWNVDVKLTDCHAQNGIGGAPFSLRYTKGLTWSSLTADNCEGLVDMIGVHGCHGSGGHSTRDVYPKDNLWNGNRGSLSMLHCHDITIDPCIIEGADDFHHGSLLYVGVCEDISILEPRAWLDLPIADGGVRGAYLSGRNIRVTRPSLESRGESAAIGIYLATGFSGESTVTVDDPETRGAWLRGVEVTATTTKQTVIYNPDRIASTSHDVAVMGGVTLAGAPNLINTKYGYPPARDARVIGWHHGERLGEGNVLRTRWPSGHPSSIYTDAWTSDAPYISANATVTGLLCADFGTPDVDIECQVKYGAGSAGLAFRVIDTSNFLHAIINSTSVVLTKRVAGTYTALASAALDIATAGIWHDLRVRVIGTRVVVYVDGAQSISHTLTGGDETTFATASSHGLRSDAAGANSGWYGLRIRKA